MATPTFNLPPITSISKMSEATQSKNRFRSVTQDCEFCGETVKIKKLSVASVVAIQELSKELKDSTDEMSNLKVIRLVCREGFPELKGYTDAEMNEIDLDELNKLSTAIMKHSGINI